MARSLSAIRFLMVAKPVQMRKYKQAWSSLFGYRFHLLLVRRLPHLLAYILPNSILDKNTAIHMQHGSDVSGQDLAMLRLVNAVASKKGNASKNGGFGTAHTQCSDCAAPHVADVGHVLFLFVHPKWADTLSVDPVYI